MMSVDFLMVSTFILLVAIVVLLLVVTLRQRKIHSLIEWLNEQNRIRDEKSWATLLTPTMNSLTQQSGTLDEIRKLLEKIEAKPIPNVGEAIRFELGDLRKLAELEISHNDGILGNVSTLYDRGAPDEELRNALYKHPYHRSEEVSKFVSSLNLERYALAFLRNSQRLLASADDNAEGEKKEQVRKAVEELEGDLRREVLGGDGVDWWEVSNEEDETRIEWAVMHLVESLDKWLDRERDKWFGDDSSIDGSVGGVGEFNDGDWLSPIRGESREEFFEKVSSDEDELRILRSRAFDAD
jgi:hypothetical protein